MTCTKTNGVIGQKINNARLKEKFYNAGAGCVQRYDLGNGESCSHYIG